jgi:hypothetical protein
MDTAEKPPTWVLTIDDFDGGVMRGWVFDHSRPNVPVSMEISSTSGDAITVLANGYRRDLVDANIGDGRHAFTFDISSWELDGHTITIRAAGLPDAAPLQTISTGIAESITRMPWSKQFLGLLDELAQPFAVTNDAQ